MTKYRLFIVEVLAISFIIFISESFVEGFDRNDFITKEIFIRTLTRAFTIAFLLALSFLFMKKYNENWNKRNLEK